VNLEFFTFVLRDFLFLKHNMLKYSNGLETLAYMECSLWALTQLRWVSINRP
jgi:hypothetical protein